MNRSNRKVIPARKVNLVFDTAVLSHQGYIREHNEDCFFTIDEVQQDGFGITSFGIYIVADGLGGHQAGEIASKMAVQIISTGLKEGLAGREKMVSPTELIKQVMIKANTEIYAKASANQQLSMMGTTVTLGLRIEHKLYLGHAGDSRAYLIRKGKIKQLTEDHSVIASLLRARMITEEEISTHPDRGKIFRSLGTTPEVLIDTNNQISHSNSLDLQTADTLVFCTDGLNIHVSSQEILKCVNKVKKAENICHDLVDMANSKGGEDNITVIVVNMESPKLKKSTGNNN